MDEHTLNDLLECSVCLERLDTSSKVLPCQHTFCRKCLEVIVSSRQELRCPECRVLVEVKIDDLPPNVLLMRILEGMKNAAAIKTQQQQKSHTSKSSPDIRNVSDYEQQQQHPTIEHTQIQQQQLLPVSNSINGGAQQLPQQFIQQRRCLLPHAYALYDFESSEPSDLHFKKGDLVLLKRKIDSNWYVGQLNNGNGFISEGTFPINHVQVVVPLPTPQCIALYDFKMPPNEEQGCLTFKKGTLIHVLRRVDHNWAEGCIGSSIGIFPIAFVELNALAKQVLEATYLVTNMSTAMTTAPPTIDIAALAANYSASTTSSGKQIMPHQLRNPPPMPQIDTNNSESTTSSASASNSSSSATSPQSVSTTTTTTASNSGMACVGINSGVNSTSMPSSPNQSLPASPQHESSNLNIVSGSSSVRFRDKREKRHSLNALLSAGNLHTGLGTGATLSILQSNRHSAEILSVPTETNSPDIVRNTSCDGSGEVQEGINAANVAVPQSTIAREQQQQQQIHTQQMQQKQQLPPQHTQQRVNVLKTSVVQQHIPPSLPWGYLALYPYKPRKSDELELKKGCVYIVIERCLDGWFKGKNWQDITGVFPGNYVTPLRSRDQQQLMHQWKYVPLQSSPHFNQTTIKPGSNLVPIVQSPPAVTSTTQRIHSLHQPPDLPPRQVSSALPASSVWTKPLGHTVEAFFNRYSKAHDTTREQNVKEKDSGKQKENMPNTATPTASSSTTSSAVQLMKRLAHIKSRSKSPSSAIARQQQKSPHTQSAHDSSTTTTVDDSSIHNMSKNSVCNAAQKNNTHFASAHTHAQLHPVHVRSGSCPSQLLQNLPNDPTALATAPANTSAMAQIQENMHKTQQQKHQQQQQAQMQQIAAQGVGYGSQQLRGPKERPHLQNARQSMDNATLRSIYNSSVPQQQQQQLVSNTPKNAGEQQQQIIPANIITTNHRKSHSLDAAAALSTSNNDYGAVSGSNSGQTALLAPCNITAAAVAASATTKSTQCSRESRFRCVVPYPPNSEIELELQVGDIIYVQRRQKNGWYKGTHARTNKTGLFPASFVEPDL
ncbi:E3 ubiquitin-protein ligase SH3RF1-like [Bactrocera tryoni]|uniref:E3 ubiquitin-protein ligase SH3RF1-like n=1 Tax=Bactrocera tryoni TaxID=59916 RepID=UPI001A96281E|nr:E3 ubiquitin-protein ligase SH3RF1-like [Bactrocera tryoni]